MKAKTPSQLVLQAIVYAVVIAAQTSAVLAQNTTTGIRGIVRYQTGAAVPQV
jgi:hypothetical protein